MKSIFFLPSFFSALQTLLPYKNFVLLSKSEGSPQFIHLAKQLKKANVTFFESKATAERKSFLFEVVLSYNFKDSIQSSIDLGCFPSFKNVANTELSADQQAHLAQTKRDCFCEPPKLVSTHENNRIVIDFVDNLLYLLCFHSCYIVDVLSVTVFDTAPFLADYIESLQHARARATSPVLGRIIKNLANRYFYSSQSVFFFSSYFITPLQLFFYSLFHAPVSLESYTSVSSHTITVT